MFSVISWENTEAVSKFGFVCLVHVVVFDYNKRRVSVCGLGSLVG